MPRGWACLEPAEGGVVPHGRLMALSICCVRPILREHRAIDYFMPWMIERTLLAPSAELVLPKSTSVATGVNSLLKPEALAGVTWGGGTSSGAIDCENWSATLACASRSGATSFCTAGIAGMPRSVVRTFVAAGSVSKKSTSFALASVCFERDDTDQYMDALFTIFGESPVVCAGSRSSFNSVPLAVPKAEIWVWNSR